MSDGIYLVLDLENDLVHADGPNGTGPYGKQARARRVVENTRAALDKARVAGIHVGFVRVGFSTDYRECPADSPIFSGVRQGGILKLREWGTEVHSDLGRQPSDFDIVKYRVSPFYGTNLDLILRTHGIRRIYCSGVSTNAVVQAAVREGHDRDYRMILLEDGCSAQSPEEHESAVTGLRAFCQITTSKEVVFS